MVPGAGSTALITSHACVSALPAGPWLRLLGQVAEPKHLSFHQFREAGLRQVGALEASLRESNPRGLIIDIPATARMCSKKYPEALGLRTYPSRHLPQSRRWVLELDAQADRDGINRTVEFNRLNKTLKGFVTEVVVQLSLIHI